MDNKNTSFPKQIIIETTAFCTQKCIHCGHKSLKRKKGNMEMNLYKKIIDEIAREAPDTEVWMTYYGEALILKYKLFYMIHYAKHRGLTNVILNSNAMLLDEEMAEMLIDSGLDRFIISMDGFSKETYEKIRVGGDYDKVLNNALNFLEIVKSNNIVKPKFEMQFSVLEENEHELEAFNQFWKEKGAYVKNRPKGGWAGKVESRFLDPSLERVTCKWALNQGSILWNGDFVACAVDCEGLFVAGNVNNTSIKRIWGTSHKDFRDIHIEKRWTDLPALCKGCLDWQATSRNYLEPEKRPYEKRQ